MDFGQRGKMKKNGKRLTIEDDRGVVWAYKIETLKARALIFCKDIIKDVIQLLQKFQNFCSCFSEFINKLRVNDRLGVDL